MGQSKKPHQQLGGTDTDKKLPEWALTALRDDPDLLREVAEIVRERTARSRGRRR